MSSHRLASEVEFVSPCLLENWASASGCLYPCAVPSSARLGKTFPFQAMAQELISASPTERCWKVEVSPLLTMEIDRELSEVVLSPVPTVGGSPGSKRTCLLWTTQQNPLSQQPPKPNSSTRSSPHPQGPKRHASPIIRPVAPSPGISTAARRPPRPTLDTPSAGFHVNMQRCSSKKVTGHTQGNTDAQSGLLPPFPLPSRRLLFSSSPPSSVVLSLIEPCFPCLWSPSLCRSKIACHTHIHDLPFLPACLTVQTIVCHLS